MGPESSSHKVTITPNWWLLRRSSETVDRSLTRPEAGGFLSQTVSTSTSQTFSQGVFPQKMSAPQTGPPLLPRVARPRRPGLASIDRRSEPISSLILVMPTGARVHPLPLMFAAGSRHPPVAALRGELPGKNEQPRSIVGVHPHQPSRRRALCSPCTQIRQGEAAHSVVSLAHRAHRGRRWPMA